MIGDEPGGSRFSDAHPLGFDLKIGGTRREFLWASAAAFGGLMTLATLSRPLEALAAEATPSGRWREVRSRVTPQMRTAASLMYFPPSNSDLMFGGYGANGTLGDTWAWDGGTWTQLVSSKSPPARFGATITYHAASGNLLLFGGSDDNGLLDDTWLWNGTSWAVVASGPRPPARVSAAMSYHEPTQAVVLYGGYAGRVLDDTWTWDGHKWTVMAPAVSPPPLTGASMAASSTQTILISGFESPMGIDQSNNVWFWNGDSWTGHPTTIPLRIGASLIESPETNNLFIFGGASRRGLLNDLWTAPRDASPSWDSLSDALTPAPRAAAALASNPRGGLMLFGGALSDGSLLADTWLWKQ